MHIYINTDMKVFCRAFADRFPEASLYVPPGIFNLVCIHTSMHCIRI